MRARSLTRQNKVLNLLVAMVVGIAGAKPVLATSETALMIPVNRFIDGLNKGNVKMIQKACAEQATIIDDFPPHAWRGSDAAAKWFTDMGRLSKEGDMSDIFVTPGKPRQVHITGAQAYAVVPIALRYREQGRLIKTTGVMTLALEQGAGEWRIAALAWTWSDK